MQPRRSPRLSTSNSMEPPPSSSPSSSSSPPVLDASPSPPPTFSRSLSDLEILNQQLASHASPTSMNGAPTSAIGLLRSISQLSANEQHIQQEQQQEHQQEQPSISMMRTESETSTSSSLSGQGKGKGKGRGRRSRSNAAAAAVAASNGATPAFSSTFDNMEVSLRSRSVSPSPAFHGLSSSLHPPSMSTPLTMSTPSLGSLFSPQQSPAQDHLRSLGLNMSPAFPRPSPRRSPRFMSNSPPSSLSTLSSPALISSPTFTLPSPTLPSSMLRNPLELRRSPRLSFTPMFRDREPRPAVPPFSPNGMLRSPAISMAESSLKLPNSSVPSTSAAASQASHNPLSVFNTSSNQSSLGSSNNNHPSTRERETSISLKTFPTFDDIPTSPAISAPSSSQALNNMSILGKLKSLHAVPTGTGTKRRRSSKVDMIQYEDKIKYSSQASAMLPQFTPPQHAMQGNTANIPPVNMGKTTRSASPPTSTANEQAAPTAPEASAPITSAAAMSASTSPTSISSHPTFSYGGSKSIYTQEDSHQETKTQHLTPYQTSANSQPPPAPSSNPSQLSQHLPSSSHNHNHNERAVTPTARDRERDRDRDRDINRDRAAERAEQRAAERAAERAERDRTEGSGVGSSCHQCKSRRQISHLIFCSNRNSKRSKANDKKQPCRKKYCETCLTKFYNEKVPSSTQLPTWQCPACRGICCCAACRRSKSRAEEGELEAQAAAQAAEEAEMAQLVMDPINMSPATTLACGLVYGMEGIVESNITLPNNINGTSLHHNTSHSMYHYPSRTNGHSQSQAHTPSPPGATPSYALPVNTPYNHHESPISSSSSSSTSAESISDPSYHHPPSKRIKIKSEKNTHQHQIPVK